MLGVAPWQRLRRTPIQRRGRLTSRVATAVAVGALALPLISTVAAVTGAGTPLAGAADPAPASISVTNTPNPTTVSAADQTVGYTFAITNGGPFTLTQVGVADIETKPSANRNLSTITCRGRHEREPHPGAGRHHQLLGYRHGEPGGLRQRQGGEYRHRQRDCSGRRHRLWDGDREHHRHPEECRAEREDHSHQVGECHIGVGSDERDLHLHGQERRESRPHQCRHH